MRKDDATNDWYFGLCPQPGYHKHLLKSPLAESHHGKGPHEAFLSSLRELVEEMSLLEPSGVAPLGPAAPRPSLVLVCLSCNCIFTGSLCSKEVSQETILLGNGAISKCFGI